VHFQEKLHRISDELIAPTVEKDALRREICASLLDHFLDKRTAYGLNRTEDSGDERTSLSMW